MQVPGALNMAMEFQQENYMYCISLCYGESCTGLSKYVLCFVVLCTHLSQCDCGWHAVGNRCTRCDVLFTLTMLL